MHRSPYRHFVYTPRGSYLLQPDDSTAVGCRPMEITAKVHQRLPSLSPRASNFMLPGMYVPFWLLLPEIILDHV